MRILTTVIARSVWLFPTEDINPKGMDLVPVWAQLKNRYQFHRFPSKPEDYSPQSGGIQFAKGAFRLEDGSQIEILSLTVYSDGVVAETKNSTDATDAFVRDVLATITKNPQFVFKEEMVRKKAYASHLIATSELDLDAVGRKFLEFCALLSTTVGTDSEFKTVSLRFGTDSTSRVGAMMFSFERQENHGFSENRYYSQAPTSTQDHEKLLDAWERMFAN